MTTKRRNARSPKTNGLWPGENSDIRKEIATVVADPEGWLDAPNEWLSMAKPRDFIGTDREQFVWDLIHAIKLGLPT